MEKHWEGYLRSMSSFKSFSGFFHCSKPDKSKVPPYPNIWYIPKWCKVPFNITDSCVDWVKVDDKQRLSGLSVCCWFITITSSSSITLLEIKKNVRVWSDNCMIWKYETKISYTSTPGVSRGFTRTLEEITLDHSTESLRLPGPKG